MKKVILLTNARTGEKVLIGVESIITAKRGVSKSYSENDINCTEIASRHAMVTTTFVTETPEEIYELCK